MDGAILSDDVITLVFVLTVKLLVRGFVTAGAGVFQAYLGGPEQL